MAGKVQPCPRRRRECRPTARAPPSCPLQDLTGSLWNRNGLPGLALGYERIEPMSQPLPGQENRGEPEQRPDQGRQLPPLPPPPPQPYGRHFGYDPRTMYPTAPPEQRPPVGTPRVAGSRRTQGGILGTLGA